MILQTYEAAIIITVLSTSLQTYKIAIVICKMPISQRRKWQLWEVKVHFLKVLWLINVRGKIWTQACWVLEPALRTRTPDLPSKEPALTSVELSPNLLHCLRAKCPWGSSLTFLSFTVLNCKMETASPACSLIVGNESRSLASCQEVLPLTLEFLPQC